MGSDDALADRVLPEGSDYEAVYRRFRWRIPATYNIAQDVCDRHARDRTRLALIYEDESGRVTRHTFAEFSAESNRFAHVLESLGVSRGDRVGILLSQRPETAVAHLATYKLGAIALPLSTLFGPDALDYRLRDAAAKVLVTDAANLERALGARDRLTELAHVVCVDPADAEGIVAYRRALDRFPDSFDVRQTLPVDPALIIYTSGTTGPPKGALLPHQAILGHLPCIEFDHNRFPQPGDRAWSPADWAWVGGLTDILLSTWHYGVTVVAHRAPKFDAAEALDFMARHHVRNTVLVPTMLRLMRQVGRVPPELNLRSIIIGGEPVGAEIIRWAQEALAVTPNEVYGQTEMNLVVGNCSVLMPVKVGSTGRPVPGHVVDIVDDDGRVLPRGQIGEAAVRRPDPIMFLRYWNNPAATEAKFIGDWARTGDLLRKDEDGYFWFVGRMDDVISSGGYRIGPGEIEECLGGHPAVTLAAVVGSPHPIRGEVVKAFVQLRDGVRDSPELASELSAYVRERLSAHEFPREIEFMEALPTTTTGKVKRGELRRLEWEGKGAD